MVACACLWLLELRGCLWEHVDACGWISGCVWLLVVSELVACGCLWLLVLSGCLWLLVDAGGWLIRCLCVRVVTCGCFC